MAPYNVLARSRLSDLVEITLVQKPLVVTVELFIKSPGQTKRKVLLLEVTQVYIRLKLTCLNGAKL